MRRAALLLVAAACSGHHDRETIEPAAKKDAPLAALPADAAPAPLVLAPAPPLPPVPAGLPPLPDTPAQSAVTPDAVALGELLFYDARLSSTGALACATCHAPAHDYAGGIDATADGKPNARRTPALANLAWATAFGWDGRYASLDDLLPVHVSGQLGAPLTAAVARVADLPLYRAHFARVGGAPDDAARRALAAFVLTRYEGGSLWDASEVASRAPKPGEKVDPLVAGYVLFTGKARCASCHAPPLYTDHAFHKVVADPRGDPGRGKVDPALAGAFATPTLRGAAARAVFLHTGAASTVEQAIDAHLGADRDPLLAGLKLSAAERASLVAFVGALTSSAKPPAPPALP